LYLEPTQRRLLSSLNPIIIVLFAVAIIILKTSLIPLYPKMFQRWDILLPFIIYFGLKRNLIEGLILSILTSHLFSLSSSAPVGFYLAYYTFLFFLIRLISLAIYSDTSTMVLLLIFVSLIFSKLFIPFLAKFFGYTIPMFGNIGFIEIILNTLSGFLVYWIIWLIDAITFKASISFTDVNEA